MHYHIPFSGGPYRQDDLPQIMKIPVHVRRIFRYVYVAKNPKEKLSPESQFFQVQLSRKKTQDQKVQKTKDF